LLAGKTSGSDRTTRTSISLPEDLKRKMDATDVNWSAYLREAITERLKWEEERNVAEAVLLNEKLRRKAPKGWDSAEAIREWRSRRS
jgi:Arc/MetJ-type ribon-helix-helix transcriptional regulator